MNNDSHGAFKSYVAGFMLSFVLTIASYLLVIFHLASGHRVPSDQVMVLLLPGLAFVQLLVQLIFFIHLGQEAKPRWNLIFFLNTFFIILLIVVGSLWIMNHLNYNMTPKDMNTHILKEEGIHK